MKMVEQYIADAPAGNNKAFQAAHARYHGFKAKSTTEYDNMVGGLYSQKVKNGSSLWLDHPREQTINLYAMYHTLRADVVLPRRPSYDLSASRRVRMVPQIHGVCIA